MALFWLIHEWLLRLSQARRQLAEDARGGGAWMLRIRMRILAFLVSRYEAEEHEGPRNGGGEGGSLDHERETYCIVSPEEHPPRRCGELRVRLGSIRRINADKRPRWRWFV